MSIVDQTTTSPVPTSPHGSPQIVDIVVPAPRPAPSAVPAAARPPGTIRTLLHVTLAALPLLAITAHVLGVVDMHTSAALLVVPAAVALLTATAFFPHPSDRVLLLGWAWGLVACVVYDVFRLDTVYLLGWWGDFIPTMGTWITAAPGDRAAGAVTGYLWRYLGDAGGIGVTFFALASVVGLHRRTLGTVVAAAVGFAVFPVWSGLVVTVWLSGGGPYRMFPLTPVTLTLSLVGHLIFGVVLGLGFWRTRAAHERWPWRLDRGGVLSSLRRRPSPASPS